MECINHHETEATVCCTQCGAYICNDCICTVNNLNVCPACFRSNSINYRDANFAAANTELVKFIFYLALYFGGWILAGAIGGFWIIVGFIMIALPGLISIKSNTTVFYTSGWAMFGHVLGRFIFGIIWTPILIIKTIVSYFGYRKAYAHWRDNLETIETAFPNLVH